MPMTIGAVSSVGAAISSIAAKIVECKYDVKNIYMTSVKNHINNLLK